MSHGNLLGYFAMQTHLERTFHIHFQGTVLILCFSLPLLYICRASWISTINIPLSRLLEFLKLQYANNSIGDLVKIQILGRGLKWEFLTFSQMLILLVYGPYCKRSWKEVTFFLSSSIVPAMLSG